MHTARISTLLIYRVSENNFCLFHRMTRIKDSMSYGGFISIASLKERACEKKKEKKSVFGMLFY